MRRRLLLLGLIVAVPVLAACEPLPPAPPTPCYVGTFSLDGVTFAAPIDTPFGPETVNLKSGGTGTLTTTNNTWNLEIHKPFGVKGNFTGTVRVDAVASGTFTVAGSTMTFAVASLSGTAHVVGTDITETLPGSYIDDLAELSGAATYSCSPGGLSLAFSSVSYEF